MEGRRSFGMNIVLFLVVLIGAKHASAHTGHMNHTGHQHGACPPMGTMLQSVLTGSPHSVEVISCTATQVTLEECTHMGVCSTNVVDLSSIGDDDTCMPAMNMTDCYYPQCLDGEFVISHMPQCCSAVTAQMRSGQPHHSCDVQAYFCGEFTDICSAALPKLTFSMLATCVCALATLFSL